MYHISHVPPTLQTKTCLMFANGDSLSNKVICKYSYELVICIPFQGKTLYLIAIILGEP